MNELDFLNVKSLTQGVAYSNVTDFLINLTLAAVLCHLVGVFYAKRGNSLSNRASFARNFIILGMTTMVIISVVKSSIALSLGLVGALSIVRFRTAVKEPEELAYLFVVIAIGLGLGADQRIITLLGVPVILGVVHLKSLLDGKATEGQRLFLSIETNETNETLFSRVAEVVRKNTTKANLKRMDHEDSRFEVSFVVELTDIARLELLRKNLLEAEPSLKIRFVDPV